MLRRQLSGSFVCLSCRLQLRGQAAGFQRRPFALSPRARKTESSAAERQRIIDGIAGVERGAARPHTPSATPKSRPPSNDDSFERDDAEPNEPKQGQETPAKKLEQEDMVQIQKYAYDNFRRGDGTLPLDSDNNTVRSRGQRFQVGGEDLPIEILGKPGAAIVMRARGGRLKKFVPEEPVVGEDPGTDTGITEALETALDAEDQDYLLNIHELRQTDRTLTEVEFNALGDALLKGFTKVQLEEYLADSESFPREPVQEEVPQVPDPEWVVSRRPWIPDPAEGARVRGDIMRGYLTKSMSPKQRLVAELLRKRWGLSCDSISGNMGRLDVALRDAEFGLLLLGSKKWLRDITRNYLETGCQIEIIVASSTVSIRAPRTRSEVILQAINNVLSKSKTGVLDADLISPEPIDPGLLEDVGRITNSIVRPSGRQIFVTWINLPEPAQGLEDLADVVFRYLLSAFHSQPRAASAVKILPHGQAAGGRSITNFACQPQLPWHERRKQWARWVVASPARKEGEAKKPSKPRSIPANFLPHKIEVKEPTKMPDPFSGDPIPVLPPSRWSSDLVTDTQAIFGQVLHAQPSHPPSPSAAPTASQSLDKSLPRSFVPTLPPLTAFGFPSNIHEEGLWHSILVLQFLPSPSSPDAPPLELRVEADHAELKRIVSLRAVTSSFIGDILFPAAPVDVRLRQDRYFELLGDGIDVHAPAILEFLKAADLRPWAGKLATPPTLEGLMLPRRILGLSPSSSSSSEGVGAQQDAVQVSVRESDIAVPELKQDTVRETTEETASPATEAEEGISQALAEDVSAPDVAAEQEITQELAEETASPVHPIEQEAAHDTTPDSTLPGELPEETASPDDASVEEPSHETTITDHEASQDTIPDTQSPNQPQPHQLPPHPAATPEPDLVPVSYRFAGIEIHRVVTANYEGFLLGYRSVEAGQRGGKRSELVLRAAAAPPEPGSGRPRKPVVVDAAAFLHIASGLTTKVEGGGPSGSEVFSWHGAKDREDGDDGYLYVR
ncbi:mitochondrial inner-membrane-bound regulator-domain-containing protein [Schizothecium vesticola]|uniref:Mitochondrial inner-membrane-bound regulator-domain-containing protein n=1 Tax=Schizothecium vesticola TaxID=314040 RepID=A0AA40F210_9PEZI|nr:mitochondrial inner-membrane-bound regulator-domain-containing protein [Schizothecium vesticola]